MSIPDLISEYLLNARKILGRLFESYCIKVRSTSNTGRDGGLEVRAHPKRNVEADEKTVDVVYMKRRPILGRSSPHMGQKKNSITAKMLKIQELSFSDTPFLFACTWGKCLLLSYAQLNNVSVCTAVYIQLVNGGCEGFWSGTCAPFF